MAAILLQGTGRLYGLATVFSNNIHGIVFLMELRALKTSAFALS